MTDPDRPGDRREDAARLADLERRLAARTRVTDGPRPMATHDQAHVAWRMVIELVAGLGIGFVIGYGLDLLFGTMPIMLILFVFLGLGAGVKTMLRTAEELKRPAPDGTGEDNERG